MDEQQPTSFQDPANAVLMEFGTRLNEIEEKQRLLKDRILLIGENLISTKEEHEKEILEIKNKIKQFDFEISSLKKINKRIIEELENFARKTDLEIIERQIKIFEPYLKSKIQK